MTNKELNLAILAKLYEIAERVWQKMSQGTPGSYRANEIQKELFKSMFFHDDFDQCEVCKVEVGSFHCEFQRGGVFNVVANFERIAGIGQKAHLFEYNGNKYASERGGLTVEIRKDMMELCDFVNKEDSSYVTSDIFVDADNNRLVATDGHKLVAIPAIITGAWGETKNLLIDCKAFKKICGKLKKGGKTKLNITSMCDLSFITYVNYEGIVSSVQSESYVNWRNAIGKVSNDMAVRFSDWQEVKRIIKAHSGDVVFLFGERGSDKLTLSFDDGSAFVQLQGPLKHGFKVCMSMLTMLMPIQIDAIYINKAYNHPLYATNNAGYVYILCPMGGYDGYVGDKVADGVFDLAGASFDFDLLQTASEITEKSEVKEVAPSKHISASKSEAIKNKAASCRKQEVKVKKSNDGRKFTFEAIGIKPGTIITFAPSGCKVTTTEDNKVEHMGETYTLSGFCKKFMPANKRNKAESYRGCAFFTYMGVKLEKMFKEALKQREENEESETMAPAEPVVTVETEALFCLAATIETETPTEIEAKAEIIQIKTLAEKCYQAVISPAFKVAPFVVLDIGTFVKDHQDVVHELPLPPPHIGSG